MTFWQAIKASYAGGVAFLLAHPLLALFPVAFELLQHGIEVHIGMYASLAAAKALEHDPLRMGFGLLKVAALELPGYWTVRFLAWRDPARTARADQPAVRLFATFLAVEFAMAAVQLFALPQTGTALLVAFVVSQVVGILLFAWGVAAALGNVAVGARRSAAIMARQIPWTFAFSLTVMLPLMVPHYALGALAIVGRPSLLWPVLLTDSLLVGVLSAVLIAGGYYAAMRAAALAGVSLIPADRWPLRSDNRAVAAR